MAPATIAKDLGLKGTITASGKTDGVTGYSSALNDLTSTTTSIGALGAKTYVYKTGATTVEIYTITEYLAKVDKVNEAKGDVKANVELTVYGAAASNADANQNATGSSKITYETADFARDAYVVVTLTKANSTDYTIQSMEAATAVAGPVTSYTAGTLTIGGTAYTLAAQSSGGSSAVKITLASTIFTAKGTYYVSGDTVLGFVGEQVDPSDYVYVIAYQSQKKGGSTTDLFGQVTSTATEDRAVAEVIFPDGTHSIIDLAVNGEGKFQAPKDANGSSSKDGNPDGKIDGSQDEFTVAAVEVGTGGANRAGGKVTVGYWYAYVKVGNAYTLSDVMATKAAVQGANVELTAGSTKAIETSYYTTSNTEVVTIIKDTYVRTSAKGLVGTTLTVGDTHNVLAVYDNTNKTVTALYAVNQTAPISGTVFAYAVSQGQTTAQGTEYVFAVNGAQQPYVVSEGSVTLGNAYTLTPSTTTEGTYKVDEGKVITSDHTNDKTVAVADTSFLVIGSDTVTITENTKVYDVRSAATVVGAAGTVKAGDTVVIIKNDDNIYESGTATASIIYIVDAAA